MVCAKNSYSAYMRTLFERYGGTLLFKFKSNNEAEIWFMPKEKSIRRKTGAVEKRYQVWLGCKVTACWLLAIALSF